MTDYCRYCDVPLTPGNRTLDHVWPKSRYPPEDKRGAYGLKTSRNKVLCCKACNQDKRAMFLSQWLLAIEAELRRDDLPDHRRLLLDTRRLNINEMATEFAFAFWPPHGGPATHTPKTPPPPPPPKARVIKGPPISRPRFLKP